MGWYMTTHNITMVNAGHQPPLQVMENGEIISPEAGSIPLGIMPDVVFEEYNINIEGSDLYLFTDGLTECWYQRDQQLGDEGVRDIIRKFSDIIPADRLPAIVRSATKWKREHTGYLYDDVTMMLISTGGKKVD